MNNELMNPLAGPLTTAARQSFASIRPDDEQDPRTRGNAIKPAARNPTNSMPGLSTPAGNGSVRWRRRQSVNQDCRGAGRRHAAHGNACCARPVRERHDAHQCHESAVGRSTDRGDRAESLAGGESARGAHVAKCRHHATGKTTRRGESGRRAEADFVFRDREQSLDDVGPGRCARK